MSGDTVLCVVIAAITLLGLAAALGPVLICLPSRRERRVRNLKLAIEEEQLKRELLTMQGRRDECNR